MGPRASLAAQIAATVLMFVAFFVLGHAWDLTVPSFGGARYQAVFLANGQTYFGRYVERIGTYVKIEDAYYIQQGAGGDEATPPESRLIRRGSELHQPYPYVLIPKSAILFVEDLRPGSAVGEFMAKEAR